MKLGGSQLLYRTTVRPKDRVCLGGSCRERDGRDFCRWHPGQQLLSSPLVENYAGGGRQECGPDARPAASLRCWGKVLSSKAWEFH